MKLSTLILTSMKISLMVEDHKCCDQDHVSRDQSCIAETVSVYTLAGILTDEFWLHQGVMWT